MFYDHFKAILESMVHLHPVFHTHIDLLNQAKVYDISEVSQYYHSRPQVYKPEDFPNIAPPFRVMWFEYPFPEYSQKGDERLDFKAKFAEANLQASDFGVGCWLLSLERPEWDKPYKLPAYVKWQCTMYIALSKYTQLTDTDFARMQWFVTDSGKFYLTNGEPRCDYQIPRSILRSVPEQDAVDAITTNALPAFMTLSLLHCKNVEIVEYSAKQAKERKLEKALKFLKPHQSLKKHYTLKVSPVSKQYRAGKPSSEWKGGERKETAWHQVPGQFRQYGGTYPDGRPRGLLFGKWSGLFWVPSHDRGRKEGGEITHDYKVEGVSSEKDFGVDK